jgi:hypothetical protein
MEGRRAESGRGGSPPAEIGACVRFHGFSRRATPQDKHLNRIENTDLGGSIRGRPSPGLGRAPETRYTPPEKPVGQKVGRVFRPSAKNATAWFHSTPRHRLTLP